MTALSFGSAFCIEGHLAFAAECNRVAAEESLNQGDCANAAIFAVRTVRPISFAEMVCDDILGSIPILAQISGIFTIMISMIFLNGPDTQGRHSFGTGLVVRGILECLNLGLILLITDVVLSLPFFLNSRSEFTITVNIGS